MTSMDAAVDRLAKLYVREQMCKSSMEKTAVNNVLGVDLDAVKNWAASNPEAAGAIGGGLAGGLLGVGSGLFGSRDDDEEDRGVLGRVVPDALKGALLGSLTGAAGGLVYRTAPKHLIESMASPFYGFAPDFTTASEDLDEKIKTLQHESAARRGKGGFEDTAKNIGEMINDAKQRLKEWYKNQAAETRDLVTDTTNRVRKAVNTAKEKSFGKDTGLLGGAFNYLVANPLHNVWESVGRPVWESVRHPYDTLINNPGRLVPNPGRLALNPGRLALTGPGIVAASWLEPVIPRRLTAGILRNAGSGLASILPDRASKLLQAPLRKQLEAGLNNIDSLAASLKPDDLTLSSLNNVRNKLFGKGTGYGYIPRDIIPAKLVSPIEAKTSIENILDNLLGTGKTRKPGKGGANPPPQGVFKEIAKKFGYNADNIERRKGLINHLYNIVTDENLKPVNTSNLRADIERIVSDVDKNHFRNMGQRTRARGRTIAGIYNRLKTIPFESEGTGNVINKVLRDEIGNMAPQNILDDDVYKRLANELLKSMRKGTVSSQLGGVADNIVFNPTLLKETLSRTIAERINQAISSQHPAGAAGTHGAEIKNVADQLAEELTKRHAGASRRVVGNIVRHGVEQGELGKLRRLAKRVRGGGKLLTGGLLGAPILVDLLGALYDEFSK